MTQSPPLSQSQQTQITRVVIMAGQILQQHGAESKLIEQTSTRLGIAMGLDSTEMSISADAIVMTSLYQGRCITTTRRVLDKGINMHMVCEVQRITLMAERKVIELEEIGKRLQAIEPIKYNQLAGSLYDWPVLRKFFPFVWRGLGSVSGNLWRLGARHAGTATNGVVSPQSPDQFWADCICRHSRRLFRRAIRHR